MLPVMVKKFISGFGGGTKMQDGDNLSHNHFAIRHSVVFNGDNMKMMHHVCTSPRRDYLKIRENTKHSYLALINIII